MIPPRFERPRRDERVTAVSIGAHAASRLSACGRGRVLAVFARGFHVLFDGGFVLTVGEFSLGSGPSNLLVVTDALDALGDAVPGDAVTASRRGMLHVAMEATPASNGEAPAVAVDVDWTEAPRYRTPALPPASDTATLRAARARLAALNGAPAEGFGWRLRATVAVGAVGAVGAVEGVSTPNGLRHAFRDATRAPLEALDNWLVDVFREGPVHETSAEAPGRELADALSDERKCRAVAPTTHDPCAPLETSPPAAPAAFVPPAVPTTSAPLAVRSLLGAGPGLTPSGDDLLAGTLLALHRSRRPDAADALWRTLAPALGERTHPFSAAQLALAASGQHAASVGTLLDAVFDTCPEGSGARAAPTLRRELDALGATSGWDLVAGIVAVTDARLATGGR